MILHYGRWPVRGCGDIIWVILLKNSARQSVSYSHIRSRCVATFALALCLIAASIAAHAQTYPTKPIRLVLGFPAGTNVDILARPVALRMSEALGQQVIVDNRPGATGLIANELVAKSAPDGYTLLVAPGSSLTSTPHLRI